MLKKAGISSLKNDLQSVDCKINVELMRNNTLKSKEIVIEEICELFSKLNVEMATPCGKSKKSKSKQTSK